MTTHQLEMLSALLALGDWNPLVNGGLPSWKAHNAEFDVFFDVSLNKLMDTQVAGDLIMILMWHHCDTNNHMI